MLESHDPNLVVRTLSVSGLELPRVKPAPACERATRAWWEWVHLGKVALLVASLFLFVLSITLMKEGARGLAPLVREGLAVTNTANGLGFGWLSAHCIMSGSPVAATALTFFDAGVVDKPGAYAMITGSRLGASFIVLLIGFLYALRGRDRATSLSMGLLSLTVTGTVYLPGLFLGIGVLRAGLLDRVQLGSGALLHSLTDRLVDPIVGFMAGFLPGWAVFGTGLGIILLSFSLFDRCLPQMTLKESQVGPMSRLVYRPWVMFALGALVTLVSMSVSLSLSILVPLGHRGLVRRENVVPYIMGANITTFIDTLLAAVLLNNPAAFTIVLVEMFSTTLLSMGILAAVYRRYERAMLGFVTWVIASNRNLTVFMVAIFALPVFLMLI